MNAIQQKAKREAIKYMIDRANKLKAERKGRK